MRFQRISKQEAKKRFLEGKVVYFCPCKMSPEGPWSSACLMLGEEYLEKARWYATAYEDPTDSPVWLGSVEKTAWGLAESNWNFYNSSFETGYYAHYYKEYQNHDVPGYH